MSRLPGHSHVTRIVMEGRRLNHQKLLPLTSLIRWEHRRWLPASPDPGNGEGAREIDQDHRHSEVNCESRIADPIRAAYFAWTGRHEFRPDRLSLFDRQAERLASGEDLEAWTHPQNGTVVPPEDRPRVFGFGLHHLQDVLSHTLRGGVMYAVAKHYRTPPPVPGTEHAAVLARGSAEEDSGRSSSHAQSVAAPIELSRILGGRRATRPLEEDSIQRWEREHVDECVKLRERVARQLAAEVRERQVSEHTLRIMGRAQYSRLVLQPISADGNGSTGRSNATGDLHESEADIHIQIRERQERGSVHRQPHRVGCTPTSRVAFERSMPTYIRSLCQG
jgi:hypothetical protein